LPTGFSLKDSRPFFLSYSLIQGEPKALLIEGTYLKWDQKNSLIETRSSTVRGVALGKVSLANRIKSSGAL
jgi:hypothetical protein